MSKVAVVYWSGTGNTEAMASAVVDGVREGGAKAELFTASEFDASMLSSFDAVAFGCPSMGSEQLEDSEFEPMFNSCEGDLGGKKIALFGSYGWGDGEWMRNWEETCTTDGARRSVRLLQPSDNEISRFLSGYYKALSPKNEAPRFV